MMISGATKPLLHLVSEGVVYGFGDRHLKGMTSLAFEIAAKAPLESEFMFWGCFTYDKKGQYHIWKTETAAEKLEAQEELGQLHSERCRETHEPLSLGSNTLL